MKKSNLIFLLLFVFLVIGGFLLIKLWLNNQNLKTKLNQPIPVEIVNTIPNLTIGANTDKLVAMLKESGFLIQNRQVLNLNSSQLYSPVKIIFIYQPFTSTTGSLLETFQISGQVICGYNINQDSNIYAINFYFDQNYLSHEQVADRDYLLRSATIKAVLNLGLVHQNQVKLSNIDRETIKSKLPDFLNRYADILEIH